MVASLSRFYHHTQPLSHSLTSAQPMDTGERRLDSSSVSATGVNTLLSRSFYAQLLLDRRRSLAKNWF
jgi:hypothetical protein